MAIKGFVVFAGITLTACGGLSAPELKFVHYGESYASKPDFARVEHEYPLAAMDLAKLTPEILRNYDQEQIEQLYARLPAGVMPDGLLDGSPFFPKTVSSGTSEDRRLEIIDSLKGVAGERKTAKLDLLTKYLWQKKIFYRDRLIAHNRIDDIGPFKHLIEGDPTAMPTITVDGKEERLMFPARLYCGQSLLDSRRESIIIDYSYGEDISGYRELPDYLTGRRGMQVRDEIRMVRPGFYLGRAYLGKIFLLNFTLYDKELAERELPVFLKNKTTRQHCWQGEQKPPVAAGPEWRP
jgi:hypothetical protein